MSSQSRVRRRTWMAIPLLAVLAVPGCAYNYTFRTQLPKADEPIKQMKHIGLWGWVANEEPFDLEAACPTGVAEFGSYISFVNWVPSFFTIGLYSPRTIYVYCASTKMEALQ